MFSAIDAGPRGVISRHLSFPRFDWMGSAATGHVDYWFTDNALARPRLLASVVGSDSVG